MEMDKDSDCRCWARISISLTNKPAIAVGTLAGRARTRISPVDVTITTNVQKHPSFSPPAVALELASVILRAATNRNGSRSRKLQQG